MAYQLAEINSALRADPAGFVAQCEANYQQRIVEAGERILQNLSRNPIVLLSGPSGSGKTTTALKLEQELERRGVNTHTVSMDNYFKTLNRETASRTPEGDIDYESPERLDMALLDAHFSLLSRGELVYIPKFDFNLQTMLQSHDKPLQLKKNEVAIFEGIHALNDDIAGRHPEATTLYISARSNILEGEELRFKGTWMRLTRRIVRDYQFRGKAFSDTMAMLYNVRRGEKKYISPFKNRAEIIIDSSLRYEAPLFRSYAQDLALAAQQVPRDNPRYAELQEFADAFRHFEPLDASLVPENSLMREFLGGSSYYY